MNPGDRKLSGDAPLRDTARGAEASLFSWARESGEVEQVVADLARCVRARRRRRLRFAGAVACLAMLGGVGFWQMHRSSDMLASPGAPVAKVLWPEKRELPDGSVVELRPGAQIEVSFSASARRIALRTGEAHFQVKKDASRPFVVEARGVEVVAVGTAFSVELGATEVDVVVTEGRIAVDPRATPLVTVDHGQRAVVPLSGENGAAGAPQVSAFSAQQCEERLAWRAPRLEFAGAPLGEVVKTFNQHNRVRLQVGDASLEKLQLSGILRANNIEALLRVLEREYGVHADRTDREIVLRR